MSTNAQEWYMELSGEVAQALNENYGPLVQGAMEELGIEGPDVLLTQTAYSLEPRPLTTDVVLERTPYMAESAALSRLAEATKRGALMPVGEGAYGLTEKGRKFASEVPKRLVNFLGKLEPRPAEELERLATLLRRLVDASMSAEPDEKPVLVRSRAFDPGPDAPVLERIRRYLNDLNAFRDDAHVAAWGQHGVEGYEWEAFSHIWGEVIWGDKVSTAAEVAEKLAFRGYELAEYEASLQASVQRGWLEESDGRFAVTEAGAKLRRDAEETTDAFFFGPWQELSAEESSELRDLLKRLGEGLKKENKE